MKEIKLILCDLDGTILDSEKRIPANFYQVLKELQKRNIQIGMATGRPLSNIEIKFPEAKQYLCNVAENGGCVSYQGEILHSESIPLEKCAKVVKKVREIGHCGAVLCALHATYIENDDPCMVKKCKEYYPDLIIVEDLFEVKDTIVKISIFDFVDSWTNSYVHLKDIDADLDCVTSGHDWADLMNKGVSKAKGIQYLCDHMGIGMDQVMAFGDEMNDYAMLTQVGYAIAMENAVEPIKNICKEQCESNDNNGVMNKIIAHFDLFVD